MAQSAKVICLSVAVLFQAEGMRVMQDTKANETSAFCKDAACCKANAKNHEDGLICDEFYDTRVGIVYSMIQPVRWTEIDKKAGVRLDEQFLKEPPRDRKATRAQSTSITHHNKEACPYQGAGSQWGFVFSIAERTNFWKYFMQCKDGALAAKVSDGWKCGPEKRTPLAATSKPYSWFKGVKDDIVKHTTGHHYNEFNTVGLSPSALAGIFVPTCLHWLKLPAKADVCHVLKKIDAGREWPVYKYDNSGPGSGMKLTEYLNCGTGPDPQPDKPTENPTPVPTQSPTKPTSDAPAATTEYNGKTTHGATTSTPPDATTTTKGGTSLQHSLTSMLVVLLALSACIR